MKILRSSLILGAILLAAAIFTGCTTQSPGSPTPTSFASVNTNGVLFIAGVEINPAAVGTSLSGLADIGATYEISKDANARAYFGAAAAVISAAISSGDYDPTNIQSSLSSISVNELKNSATAQAVITSVLSQYNAYFAQITSTGASNLSPYIVPALQGIANGLQLAVNATAPPPVETQ